MSLTFYTLGDLNGDNELDAVFANFGETNRVCLGDGSGGFSCGDVNSNTKLSRDVALGDVDGDNKLDAVFANANQNNRVCLGDGSGGFSSCSGVSPDTKDSEGMALGDVNKDNMLDAVFANVNQKHRVCLGDGSGGFSCSDVSIFDANISLGVALVNGDAQLATNQDPTADAGLDQSVEWEAGEVVNLDGSQSSDPDPGDTLSYSWTITSKPLGSSATLNGATTATPSFTPDVLGVYELGLEVSDGKGGTATDTVQVTVRDTTAPDVTAALVPVPDKVEEDEGQFTAEASCTDACDAAPQATWVMVTPVLDGLQVKKKVKPRVKVVFDFEEGKVKIEGPDPDAVVTELLSYGGLLVPSGQLMKLEVDDEEDEATFKFDKNGTLKIEGPAGSFILKVTCTDSSGNSATATATPTFGPEEEEEEGQGG